MKIAKIVIPALAVVAAVTVTAFVITSHSDKPVAKAAPAKQAAAQQEPARDAPNVLYTTSSEASLQHDFDTIAELNKCDFVDAIVKGTVTATKDVYEDDYAMRLLTVDVQKCFKGQTATTIQVYEDGGLVPVKLLLPEMQIHGGGNNLTQEQIDTGVVDVRFLGAPHSEVGDTVLLYLYNNPNAGHEGTYQLVSCTHGRFILNAKSQNWERVAAPGRPNYQASMGKSALEAELQDLQ